VLPGYATGQRPRVGVATGPWLTCNRLHGTLVTGGPDGSVRTGQRMLDSGTEDDLERCALGLGSSNVVGPSLAR
jgi:hypothetical protein